MRFAIITDTHIRTPGGDLSSPFQVNEKANARAEYAVGMTKAAEPEFTIHLGDVIHPLPHMPTAPAAAAEAQRILTPLTPNLYFVPGNHDIGDKPSRLMPAGPADPQAIEAYEKQIGPQYQSFSRGDTQIFCINSSLVNTSTPAEQQQKDWLEAELKQSNAKLKLLFTHYPPFILNAEEPDHYDNYAQPGRSWLLTIAEKYGVNTIFSGHVHHFFYNRWRDISLFCLPATSFTRQDYAELFPLAPAREYGRDDDGKFGVTLVEVHNNKVSLNILNTMGRQGEYTGGRPELPASSSTIVNLRHAWHTIKTLPYNGPMEEFSRKQARNDYPLLRLLQLGLHTIRVPGVDLLDTMARNRLDDWLALDKNITPFCTTDMASQVATSGRDLALRANTGKVTALELLISPQQSVDEIKECVDNLSKTCDLPVWLSMITSSADNPDPSKVFSHAVGCGASISQLQNIVSMARQTNTNGIVLQIPWEADLQQTLSDAIAAVLPQGLALVVNLCLRQSNPAQANFDDNAIAARISSAIRLTSNQENLHLQLDNLEDVDRGYGPRHGLIDRLSNLRAAYASGLPG